TSSSGLTFLLVMARYPHIHCKAQMELDAHVRLSRLPDISDYDSLPYICTIVMEVMRHRPVAPTGLPHKLMEDNKYNGDFIPKGTVVIANIWAILCNPIDYPDPESFNPERFLKDDKLDPTVRDPSTLTFGYG
ncbi:cytochrome P450, partial [Abortiporus biennis]